ncbi:Asp23/Gls24 family envelope stress response protein [Tepidibacter aestuarii]|uniref:ATP-binding protein n=1 Tax=Tepidibacter aestuarii TaxID=2925782 RepID=UPI0020C08FB7|nr:ATP-binding protein [Tepidibacter aestuarii]CAH2211941.1 putative tRNA dimethylallyltransferase [Tepidibacter aestuarii]
MKVYALCGPSGTGKSYRALSIAHENNIDYIIDDGILIHKNCIVTGISAKNASTKMEAVKRAIFENLEHRKNMIKAIEENDVQSILIIGTSWKMINRIKNRLELPDIYKNINMEDIATKEEMDDARKSRMEKGIHIIPLPTFEVKKHFSGLFTNPIKLLFKDKNSEIKEFEKTIIRPTFSYMGKYYISQKAIKQIVAYEMTKFEDVCQVGSISIKHNKSGINVDIKVKLKMFGILRQCENIQEKIMNILEFTTLLNVNGINIHVVDIC